METIGFKTYEIKRMEGLNRTMQYGNFSKQNKKSTRKFV